MATILNIETSTTVCSVALAKDGEVLALKESHEDKSHATLLTVFIDEIFKETGIAANDLDAIAVSEGPGSYTGLRIGVSTAKGIAYGAKKPLIAVGTMKSMANGLRKKHSSKSADVALLCPMLDARRMEVYTAMFDQKLTTVSVVAPLILDETVFAEILKKQKVVFFGNGAEKSKAVIKHDNATFIDEYIISAEDMVELSEEFFAQEQFENVAYFEPFYLKEFMATVPKNKVLGNGK